MKYLTFLIVGLLFHNLSNSQNVDYSERWIDSTKSFDGFNEFDKNHFKNIDFSRILSNQLRFSNDPLSTYIGVFGPNYRRIDFHLKVKKHENKYLINGKSKLGDNIRDLQGEMSLRIVLLREQDYITDSLYIGLFDCEFREPRDRDGDGVFSGIFTLVFYIRDGEAHIFKTDSGDPPSFTNTFVGKWIRNKTKVERKVIFSFHPAGLYEELPFCDDFYIFGENLDFSKINPKYIEFGWQDFDYRGRKTYWWQ